MTKDVFGVDLHVDSRADVDVWARRAGRSATGVAGLWQVPCSGAGHRVTIRTTEP